MLIRVGQSAPPVVGAQFFHYLLRDVYNKGEIIECDDSIIKVDFGDTILEFALSECSSVYGSGHHEHLMTFSPGRIVSDLRPRNNAPVNPDDLLDFSWMVCGDD